LKKKFVLLITGLTIAIISLALIQLGTISSFTSSRSDSDKMQGISTVEDNQRFLIKLVSNNSITPVYVEIADDVEERARGLMFRNSLEWNNGMLFIFEEERNLTFWMKNTYIPLDMIFINKDLRVVYIKENAQPCLEENCIIYPSNQPAKYVLEVNAGFVEKNKIKIGDRLEM